MTATQVSEIIQKSRKEFLETQRKYVHRGEILALRANNTTLSLTDMGKARELIAKGVEITRDYFVACEAIIFSLDSAARPELEGLSVQTVGQIADLMTEITQDMDGTTTSFNVSLNGRELGSSDLMPKPGIMAKTVQLFWKNHFETLPGYAAEMERRAAERKQEKQKKQQESQRNQDAVQAVKTRAADKNRGVAQKRAELQAKCDAALDSFRAEAEKLIAQDARYEPQVKELLRSYESDLKDHLRAAFTQQTVSETIQTVGKGVHPKDVVLDNLQNDVYYTLFYSDHWMTITQIATEGNLRESNMKIGVALRDLVEMGVVMKLEGLYGIPGTPCTIKTAVWKENTANSKKPLPAPPSLDISLPPIETVTHQPAQDKKLNIKKLIPVLLIAAVVLFVGFLCVNNWIIKPNREKQAAELAQTVVDDWCVEQLKNSQFLQENGVTSLAVSVQDIVFIRAGDLLYGGDAHYVVQLRLDCQANSIPQYEEYVLRNYLGREIPDQLGEVDGYPVMVRMGWLFHDKEVFGEKGGYFDLCKILYIYINGELEGTPNSYR